MPFHTMPLCQSWRAWYYLLFLSCAVVRGDEFPAVQKCSVKEGGGICPVGNTCCLLHDGSSGCITSDMGARNATCCSDGVGGCGVGYDCSSATQQCVATAAISDPLVQVVPRYPLCQVGKYSNFSQIHHLPIPTATDSPPKSLLYYSSHGPLESPKDNNSIRMALIVIHGANRNADDYFCTATAAVGLQKDFDLEQVLVLAPRFAVPKDVPETIRDQTLLWEDVADGSWRYGANALSTNLSSFEVMDRMVERVQGLLGPARITLAGHSSGGQFVQRWALMSPMAMHVRAVVANPSSFAYFIPERYNNGQWIRPEITKCPRYNQWEWGLDLDGCNTPEYVQNTLNEFANASNAQQPFQRLMDRFVQQSVIYLAGSLDRCNGTGWCNSHELETTCMDELQGTNRWERHERYIAMLQKVGVTKHRAVVVPGVGHDHSLVFSSPQGLQALFHFSSFAEEVQASTAQA